MMTPPAQAVSDKYAPQISQAFMDWRDAYEAGNATGTVHIEPFDPTELIRACYAEAGMAGAEAITDLVKGPSTGFSFNLRSPQAEKWIADYAAQEIKYIDSATRQTIKQITLRAFEEGLTPQQQSRLIRQYIGLLPQHATAVENFRKALGDIDPSLADKMEERYRKKLLKWRADTIALSESHSASNEGNRESTRQAMKRGILDTDEYEMELFNHADKRICPICNALRGTRCPLPGGRYGGRSGPPFHQRCRDTENAVQKRDYVPKVKELEKITESQSPSFDKLKSDRILYEDITRQLKNLPAKEFRTPAQTTAINALNEQLGSIIQNDAKLMRAAYNELIASARKEFPKVTFALDDRNGFIDPHVINETLKSLRKVTRDYPGAMPKKIVSKDLGDGIFAQWDDELKILRHNSRLVSAQARSPLTGFDQDRFERALLKNVENGYHPEGCDSIESVVTHELGHSLERTLDIRKLTPKIKEFNAAYQNVDDLSEYSKYGNSKGEYHERWAEAFASMYHTPPEKQSAFVRALKQFLDENGATK